MSILKKLSLGLIGVSITLFSTNTFAYGDTWVSATRTGAQARGYTYAICYYKTDSYTSFPNHQFSFIIEGGQYSCPYIVQYNPITGEWKQ